MNLVAGAMRRPITVLVVILAVVLAAGVAVHQMPRDIFPDLGIPVIYVAQPYGGMDPAQMEGYIAYYYEYHFLYITGIEHVESKSIQGVSLLKLQFHPGINMPQAMAETVAYVNRARSFMPPGTVPPFVIRFDAGSVPVGDLVFSSETKTVGELQDLALNRVRPLFATLPGVSAPPPFGASQRTIVVRVDPERLHAYDLSVDEVVNAIASANVIAPSGNIRIGTLMPIVPVNSVPRNIKDLEAVPIRAGKFQTVFVRDVGAVEDSTDIVTDYALVNGRRTVYIPVTKRADASTLSVIGLVKDNLAKFQSVLPEDVKVSYEFDQSPYVTRAIRGLLLEAGLGAVLTGLMVLLFLRDWRSALVVVVNIPLSLLSAVFVLWLTKASINLMTLGGLGLAVGILVDESTVRIENIHTHLMRGKPVARAALDAVTETTVPQLLAMLCVVAVFVPSFFMTGAGRALFVPLSLAVGLSMIASYLLSSTLVPVLSVWLLRPHIRGSGIIPDLHNFRDRPRDLAPDHPTPPVIRSLSLNYYGRVLGWLVAVRWPLVLAYLVLAGVVGWLVFPRLGVAIFPKVDLGQFEMRLRAPTGTRIEQTEAAALRTLEIVKEEVGADNVAISLGFVGVQPSSYPINTVYLWTGGPEEAVLNIELKRGAGIPVERLQERLRAKLAEAMPDVKFSFEQSDIISRVMNLGSPTPIEVAVSGPDMPANRAFAEKVFDALKGIPSLRDLQIIQTDDYPTVNVSVDRERAGIAGVRMDEVTKTIVAATSSSRFTTPLYWADPSSGVAYQVQVEVPEAQMTSVEDIGNLLLSRPANPPTLLRNVAEVTPGVAPGKYDRYNMQRQITLDANILGEDLGHAAAQIDAAIKSLGAPPPKVTVAVRGQVQPMQQTLNELRAGLGAAIVVILLLLAANFQSFLLAFCVMATIPAVLVGALVALWITGSSINIESFMGTIMAVGVCVANAILLTTFAERSRRNGMDSAQAAVDGAVSRIRPILMTSSAMIAGMIPMALKLSEGAEQAAPLARAVIGGLVAATFATLVPLPSIFTILRRTKAAKNPSVHPDDLDEAAADQKGEPLA